mmetsp:Transcript_122219/g.353384  ORF Transcript_122219/g.353384 Transcript_122219/m.353384 type:complete len:207 (-) Transcript_122219:1822-2442(-)
MTRKCRITPSLYADQIRARPGAKTTAEGVHTPPGCHIITLAHQCPGHHPVPFPHRHHLRRTETRPSPHRPRLPRWPPPGDSRQPPPSGPASSERCGPRRREPSACCAKRRRWHPGSRASPASRPRHCTGPSGCSARPESTSGAALRLRAQVPRAHAAQRTMSACAASLLGCPANRRPPRSPQRRPSCCERPAKQCPRSSSPSTEVR